MNSFIDLFKTVSKNIFCETRNCNQKWKLETVQANLRLDTKLAVNKKLYNFCPIVMKLCQNNAYVGG